MKLKRLIFLILGFLCLGLGCIGVALPILPTGPFFLLTVFFFANSSQKLHDWFVSTKLYKKHLESFVKKKGMTVQTKLGIIIPVTLVMGIGFFMMMRANVLVPSVILAIVWGLPYHLFRVRGQDHTKRTIRRKGLRRRKIYKYIRKTGQRHMQASEGKGEVVRNNFPFSLWIIEQHINNRFNNLAIPFAALLKQSQQLFFFRLGFLFRIKDAVGR